MSATDDIRDRIDGERLETRQAPKHDPAKAFDLIADDPHDPTQWTLSETDVTDFYTVDRWITVTNEDLICPLEARR